MKEVAVLLPGIMGSVLKLGEEVVWPGPLASLWLPYGKMRELMSEDLVAVDVIRRFSVSNQYQSLIDDLMSLGFSEADGTLVIAAYDWRKDNAHSAATLARHIDAAVVRHGQDTGITLVAHSMGGLVARYYLESKLYNGRPGFGNVRNLFTLGTPHRGAAIALPLVLGYEKRLFLNKDQVLQAVSDTRYPAAYQLLPPCSQPFAWDGTADSDLTSVDVYDVAKARRLGLVRSNLEAARAFRDRLNPSLRPTAVRYFCFVGSRQPTASHVQVRPTGDDRLRPHAIEEEAAGDGTVPTWSGTLDGHQLQYVGGEHGTIYQARGVRTLLAALLGRPGRLAGVPASVEVAIRDRVVAPGGPVRVVVGFGLIGIRDFTGMLTVELAAVDRDTGIAIGFNEPRMVFPVTYRGGIAMETMSLEFEAPDLPGPYRVSFRDEVTADPSGFDELIVQQD